MFLNLFLGYEPAPVPTHNETHESYRFFLWGNLSSIYTEAFVYKSGDFTDIPNSIWLTYPRLRTLDLDD